MIQPSDTPDGKPARDDPYDLPTQLEDAYTLWITTGSAVQNQRHSAATISRQGTRPQRYPDKALGRKDNRHLATKISRQGIRPQGYPKLKNQSILLAKSPQNYCHQAPNRSVRNGRPILIDVIQRNKRLYKLIFCLIDIIKIRPAFIEVRKQEKVTYLVESKTPRTDVLGWVQILMASFFFLQISHILYAKILEFYTIF